VGLPMAHRRRSQRACQAGQSSFAGGMNRSARLKLRAIQHCAAPFWTCLVAPLVILRAVPRCSSFYTRSLPGRSAGQVVNYSLDIVLSKGNVE